MYAFNQRIEIKAETLAACRLGIDAICDLAELDAGIDTIRDEIAVLVEMSKQLIEENSRSAQNQDEYQRRHSALIEKYSDADARLNALQTERSRRIDLRKSIEWFMESFSRQDGLLTEFDDRLFFSVCDVMTVYCDGKVVVRFRDGAEVETFPDNT